MEWTNNGHLYIQKPLTNPSAYITEHRRSCSLAFTSPLITWHSKEVKIFKIKVFWAKIAPFEGSAPNKVLQHKPGHRVDRDIAGEDSLDYTGIFSVQNIADRFLLVLNFNLKIILGKYVQWLYNLLPSPPPQLDSEEQINTYFNAPTPWFWMTLKFTFTKWCVPKWIWFRELRVQFTSSILAAKP